MRIDKLISTLDGAMWTNLAMANMNGLPIALSNIVTTNIITTNITAQTVYAATNYLGDLTITNGITNLSLIANQYIRTDGGQRFVSTLDGSMWTNLAMGNVVGLIDALTNLVATNIVVSNAYITNIFASTNYLGDVTVTNGITNLSLTASQYVATDAGQRLISTLNGASWTNLTGANVVGAVAEAQHATNSDNVTAAVLTNQAGTAGSVTAANATVTNGVTNLSLTANQYVATDTGRNSYRR